MGNASPLTGTARAFSGVKLTAGGGLSTGIDRVGAGTQQWELVQATGVRRGSPAVRMYEGVAQPGKDLERITVKSIRSVWQGNRAWGFTRRWGIIAALAALAVALAAVGAPPGGTQAEVLPTSDGDYGQRHWTVDARLAAETERRASPADEADNRLGEAYRPLLVDEQLQPIPHDNDQAKHRSVGRTAVYFKWTGSTRSTDSTESVSCELKRNDGWSTDITGKSRGTFRGLTPDTTYQFWIECKVMRNDGSSALMVGPKAEITTLKSDALDATDVEVEAGWHSMTVRWTNPEQARICAPVLNGKWDVGEKIKTKQRMYRFGGLAPGTSYVVDVWCTNHDSRIDYARTDPITVTTKELLSVAELKVSQATDEWVRITWEELDAAARYQVAFISNPGEETTCATHAGTAVWQRTQQKTKHRQTGLEPDTSYQVCLKAIGPGNDTISHAASVRARTAHSTKSLSGLEATRLGSDRIHVSWNGLKAAKYYMISFKPSPNAETSCELTYWKRAYQASYLQTGLDPDTRYLVCLKAIAPGATENGPPEIGPVVTIYAQTRPAGAVDETEQSTPDADVADNRLGEAYRPVVHTWLYPSPEYGYLSVGSDVAFLEWYASPSEIDGNTNVSCYLKRNDGWSRDVTELRHYWRAYEMTYLTKVSDLTPNTTYRFWMACKVTLEDGSSVIKVSPKGKITTLKRNALLPRDVRAEAGWGKVTIWWTKPEAAHQCNPALNGSYYHSYRGSSYGPEKRISTAWIDYLSTGTNYEVKVGCGIYAMVPGGDRVQGITASAPLSVTTKELRTLSGFEVTTQKEDRIRVRWDELDEAEHYLLSYTRKANRETECGTSFRSSGWQRVEKGKHLLTGLKPDTRYLICLKAIGPGNETISPTESILTRTASGGD